MGYHNSHSGPSVFGRFFSFFGFVCALILGVGMLNKMGVSISIGDKKIAATQETSFLKSTVSNSEEDAEAGETLVIQPRAETADEDDYSMPKGYYSNESKKKSSRSKASSSLKGGDWVERFSSMAIDQAIDKGVPAGVALAVGLAKVNDGANINTWSAFMQEVIEPLAEVKFQADGNNRRYFKYSANSKLWAEGLSKNGLYSKSKLTRTINKYDLTIFDQEVKAKLTGAPFVNEEKERKANMVADEVVSKRRKSKYKTTERAPKVNVEPEILDTEEEWADSYDELVGREVAKEIARKKMKSRQYLSEEDMANLIEQTNEETSKVMEKNLAFPGRKINKNHPKSEEWLDITDPDNSQAREELYQRKLKERRSKKQ